MLPFFKEEKFDLRTQLTFKGNRLEIYLPTYFLDPSEKIGVIVGELVESLAMFWFNVDGQMYEIQLPIKFRFEFSERLKKRFRLKPNIPEIDFDVFVLKNGDAFVYDTNHKQSVDDLSWFFAKLVEGGKMPQYVSYDDVFNIFSNILQITKINEGLGVSSVTLELLLSVLYRDRRNSRKPYRLTYRKDNPYQYRHTRIVKIPELTSTFTGILGQDTNQQIVSAVLNSRKGRPEAVSPIEKVIKY